MGWVLLQGGLTKLATYLAANPENNWTAAGYLAHAIPEGNLLGDVWLTMAGNPVVDVLLMWGLTLAHGWVVDDHLVYAALLFGLGAIGAGRMLGLTPTSKNSTWSRTTPGFATCWGSGRGACCLILRVSRRPTRPIASRFDSVFDVFRPRKVHDP